MVTLNIVTTVYSCCLISRPYSCLFDNSLCFNLWITLVKILSNWPFVCSFWPCGSVVWSRLHKTRTCTQFPHHIDWSINPFAPEPNVPCTACDVINFNFVNLCRGSNLSSHSRMNTISSRRPVKNAKKTWKVDPQILIKILLHYPPQTDLLSNPMSFPRNFSFCRSS